MVLSGSFIEKIDWMIVLTIIQSKNICNKFFELRQPQVDFHVFHSVCSWIFQFFLSVSIFHV